MTELPKRQPTTTLRDGRMKATIWQNAAADGPFYSAEFTRTYTDPNGQPQDTGSFSGSDLLKLARLAEKAYDATLSLREFDKSRQ